jgi:triphosphatase
MDKEEPDFGETPGGPLRLALWRRGQEFLAQLDRTRQEPVSEAVHECRVASRRLQAMLQSLVPIVGKKVARKLTRSVRSTRRALCKLRDVHVQLEWTEKNPELSELCEFLKSRESKRSERATDRLKKLSLGKMELQLEVVDAHLAGATEEPEGLGAVLATLRDSLHHSLTLSSEALSQVDSHHTQSYHRLRLQLKRFRYLLEMLTELGPAEGIPDLSRGQWEQLKSLQSTLGCLQDIEVLTQRLDRFWSRRPPVRRLQHRTLSALLKERDRHISRIKADLDLCAWWNPTQGET